MPYNKDMNNTHAMNTEFTIECPETGEMEITTNEDRAFDLCYAMSEEESKYACIRDTFGNIIGEYGNVMDAVDRGLV